MVAAIRAIADATGRTDAPDRQRVLVGLAEEFRDEARRRLRVASERRRVDAAFAQVMS